MPNLNHSGNVTQRNHIPPLGWGSRWVSWGSHWVGWSLHWVGWGLHWVGWGSRWVHKGLWIQHVGIGKGHEILALRIMPNMIPQSEEVHVLVEYRLYIRTSVEQNKRFSYKINCNTYI